MKINYEDLPLDAKYKPLYKQHIFERFQKTSWRDVSLTAIGVLATVLAVNAAAFFYLESSTINLGNSIVRQKWHNLQTMNAPVDWLILGDSSVSQGLDPRRFDSRLGGRSMNFGTNGGWCLAGDVWMLEAYMKRFPPPKSVLIVHVYDLYQRRLLPNVLVQAPFGFGFWNRFSFKLDLDLNDRIKYAILRYFPLYSQDQSLRQALLQPVLHQPPETAGLTPEGFMASRGADLANVEDDFHKHLRFVRENGFTVSRENEAALERLVDTAERRGFTIYFKSSPVYEMLYKTPEYQKYYASIDAWLSKIDNESDSFVYLREASPFPGSLLQSVDHLTEEGAALFTDQVADLIAARRPKH